MDKGECIMWHRISDFFNVDYNKKYGEGTKFDSKTKELAKKKLIEIINNDQCDFHWVELEEL